MHIHLKICGCFESSLTWNVYVLQRKFFLCFKFHSLSSSQFSFPWISLDLFSHIWICKKMRNWFLQLKKKIKFIVNNFFSICRFAPIIGQFKISDIATMSFLLNQVWGKVVKVGGLMGRPDLLFVYDADEIENVSWCLKQLQCNPNSWLPLFLDHNFNHDYFWCVMRKFIKYTKCKKKSNAPILCTIFFCKWFVSIGALKLLSFSCPKSCQYDFEMFIDFWAFVEL